MSGGDARAEARLGSVLDGKWKLERLLGVGGMAAVYAARHRNGARAAVKMLHPELARNAEIRERFLREGYAANRVEHPGAVAVLDDDVIVGGPDDGLAYIVMELLDGEVLDQRAQRGPFTEWELLAIAASLLEVLEAAHVHGVIHRDLKPDNLFLLRTTDGSIRVKVLDFGLARVVETRLTTRAGVTLGTPAYMSPEQAAGRADEIDARSDLFSVGAVLFRLRTGKKIHEAPNTLELVGKMARMPAPAIRDVDPDVSEAFASIVDRALEFDRAERYPDAATMRADVVAALEVLAPPKTSVVPPRSGFGLFGFAVVVAVFAAGGVAVRAGRLPASVDVPRSSPAAPAVVDASEAEADALATAVEDTANASSDADEDADEEEEEEEDDDASVDADVDADVDAEADAEIDAGDASFDAPTENVADASAAPRVDARPLAVKSAPTAAPKKTPKAAKPAAKPPKKKVKRKKKR